MYATMLAAGTFSRPEHTAGEAHETELYRETQPVLRPTPAVDQGQVVGRQGVMGDQIMPLRWQCKETGTLGRRKESLAGYGTSSRLEIVPQRSKQKEIDGRQ